MCVNKSFCARNSGNCLTIKGLARMHFNIRNSTIMKLSICIVFTVMLVAVLAQEQRGKDQSAVLGAEKPKPRRHLLQLREWTDNRVERLERRDRKNKNCRGCNCRDPHQRPGKNGNVPTAHVPIPPASGPICVKAPCVESKPAVMPVPQPKPAESKPVPQTKVPAVDPSKTADAPVAPVAESKIAVQPPQPEAAVEITPAEKIAVPAN